MNRNDFLASLLLAGFASFAGTGLPERKKRREEISVYLLRHATLLVTLGPHKILVDPMLSPKEAMPPVPHAGNDRRIPMTALPITDNALDKLLDEADMVIVSHIHRDHWDESAQSRIDKSKMILCQPSDVEIIKSQGFINVTGFDQLNWKDISFTRTDGRHGTGEIGEKMGKVSGVVLRYKTFTLYIAGDTIWCDEVQRALEEHNPDYVVVNAGAARFFAGDPITMTAADVHEVLKHSGKARVVAVHMDTINHCLLTRMDLREYAVRTHIMDRLIIPEDGETIFPKI